MPFCVDSIEKFKDTIGNSEELFIKKEKKRKESGLSEKIQLKSPKRLLERGD